MKKDLFCTRMGFLIVSAELRSSLNPGLTQDGYSHHSEGQEFQASTVLQLWKQNKNTFLESRKKK